MAWEVGAYVTYTGKWIKGDIVVNALLTRIQTALTKTTSLNPECVAENATRGALVSTKYEHSGTSVTCQNLHILEIVCLT